MPGGGSGQRSRIVEKDVLLHIIIFFWTGEHEVLSWYDNIASTDGEVPEEHSVKSVLIDVQSSAAVDKLMNFQVGSCSHVGQRQCDPVASEASILPQLAAHSLPVRENISRLHTDYGNFVSAQVHKIVCHIGDERRHGRRCVLPLGVVHHGCDGSNISPWWTIVHSLHGTICNCCKKVPAGVMVFINCHTARNNAVEQHPLGRSGGRFPHNPNPCPKRVRELLVG